MKKKVLLIGLFLFFISFINVKADTEQVQKVCVRAHVDSYYVVSIPKNTEDEVFVKIDGDIAGDERIKIDVEDTNINTYLYWNELPKVLKGTKTHKTKYYNYRISLEKIWNKGLLSPYFFVLSSC